MQDGFQAVFLLWRGKDGLTHLLSVQAALRVQETCSKHLGNANQRRLAGLNHFPGDQVGIYYGCSEAGETIGYGCLARRDTTCQYNGENSWVFARNVSVMGDGVLP